MEYNIAYDNWVSNPMLCTEGVKELREIENNEEEKKYRFGAELAFGTAGMRGIIGYGPNMMNIYTVRRATKGLCDYVCGLGEQAMTKGVVISYDTRHYSHTFALAAAAVLIHNNIRVYMYGEPRPVPMLSFAVRKLKTVAGIMITASHNPKEYNGYKVYGADGAQMSPDMTAKVVKHIEAITDYFSVKTVDVNSAAEMGAVRTLGPAFERLYYNVVRKQGLSRKAVRATGKHIKIVYTSLHGTGLVPVTSVLKRMGINVTVVGEQKSYDGDFPTVETPNPANPEALKMAVELADRIKADVVFGTDPDSDRLGVAVRNDSGEFVVLTGNQTGALLLEYILMRLKQEKKLPENAVVIKSFVSTNLAKSICRSYGVEILETPVGFKFIGEKIREYEKDKSKTFIFGFEESCGFLRGTHSRDKDAVVASMLFAELACYCAYKEKSVYSMLTDIYERLGYVYDCTEDIKFEGIGAMDEMNAVVDRLRADKLKSVDIFNVGVIRDYLTGERHVISDGEEKEEPEKLEYSGINCIYYEFVSGISVCVRPSGTEPKLKIYYSINGKDEQTCLKTYEKFSGEFEKVLRRAENK